MHGKQIAWSDAVLAIVAAGGRRIVVDPDIRSNVCAPDGPEREDKTSVFHLHNCPIPPGSR